MPPQNKFAVPEDRATPGTIDVRRAPSAVFGSSRRPTVINLFAQWEMGAPGKYNRVQPAPPSDSAASRQRWFQDCLDAVSRLQPPLASIAFPHEIGCGLAGGHWPTYDAMLQSFADANPATEVYICRWTGGGGARGGGGRGGGRGGGGNGGRSGACFKCGQPGHWANACPQGR